MTSFSQKTPTETDLSHKDRVFAKPLSSVKSFEFDEEVTQAFDDMIGRSVPGYDLLVRLIALYSDIFVTEQSRVYDLGCSTGVMSRVIAQQVSPRQVAIEAIDSSEAMIKKCQKTHSDYPIDWRCADIQSIEIENASLVVLNLTLQFIRPEQRSSLLERIYQGLNPGGVLVLTEKVVFEAADRQQRMTELYQGFKKVQGYSDLEISQKRAALENVLIPDRPAMHIDRLREAGFESIYDCFHCFNFVSYLAIKS